MVYFLICLSFLIGCGSKKSGEAHNVAPVENWHDSQEKTAETEDIMEILADCDPDVLPSGYQLLGQPLYYGNTDAHDMLLSATVIVGIAMQIGSGAGTNCHPPSFFVQVEEVIKGVTVDASVTFKERAPYPAVPYGCDYEPGCAITIADWIEWKDQNISVTNSGEKVIIGYSENHINHESVFDEQTYLIIQDLLQRPEHTAIQVSGLEVWRLDFPEGFIYSAEYRSPDICKDVVCQISPFALKEHYGDRFDGDLVTDSFAGAQDGKVLEGFGYAMFIVPVVAKTSFLVNRKPDDYGGGDHYFLWSGTEWKKIDGVQQNSTYSFFMEPLGVEAVAYLLLVPYYTEGSSPYRRKFELDVFSQGN